MRTLKQRQITGRMPRGCRLRSRRPVRVLCVHAWPYVGVDAVRYEGFPDQAEFCPLDLDSGRIPLPDASADVVAAVGVIEHFEENPRDSCANFVRLAKPGGWSSSPLPTSLGLLACCSRCWSNNGSRRPEHSLSRAPDRFTGSRSQANCHRVRFEENRPIEYSMAGRIPGTGRHYPRLWSRCFPRALLGPCS